MLCVHNARSAVGRASQRADVDVHVLQVHECHGPNELRLRPDLLQRGQSTKQSLHNVRLPLLHGKKNTSLTSVSRLKSLSGTWQMNLRYLDYLHLQR